MEKSSNKGSFPFLKGEKVMGCLIAILIGALGYALSWVITCALVTLVCMCFSWEFSLLTATGIWLVLVLIRALTK